MLPAHIDNQVVDKDITVRIKWATKDKESLCEN